MARFAPTLCLCLLLAAWASACPICDTGQSRQVRDGLADDQLPVSAAAVILPFVVVLGIVGLIHFGTPASRSKR